MASELLSMGCYEISLGDTIGVGTPQTTTALLTDVLNKAGASNFAGHFHDTNGRALDNIGVAINMGLKRFDIAVGGLGGCPYAPGASGNVATEAVMAFLDTRGLSYGLDTDIIHQAATMARAMRGDGHV